MNRVLLMGRICKPPIYAVTQSGSPHIRLDLEVIEKWRDKDGGDKIRREFIKVVQWGKNAEVTRDLAVKGDLVLAEGSLMTRSYDDKDTGKKMYITEIKADRIDVLTPENIKHNYPKGEDDDKNQ